MPLVRDLLTEAARRAARVGPVGLGRILLRRSRRTVDSHLAPSREARLTDEAMLHRLGAADADAAWHDLLAAPFPVSTDAMAPAALDAVADGETRRILSDAETALARHVDLLGSGRVGIGTPVDWHSDVRSGASWPPAPFGEIDPQADLGRADILVPWALSRLHWLLPAGQAYRLSGEERYAAFVREIVEEWLAANPLGIGVNWVSPMDVGLRAVAVAWLARVCGSAGSWRDPDFRLRVLKLLHLHGDFVERHLEWSDVNDHHLTTNLTTLVVLGHLFDAAPFGATWREKAWPWLERAFVEQVTPDGVCFEASSAYHRYAMELFLLAAAARRAAGYRIPPGYALRLERMAGFVAAYSRDDGGAPNWGDNDGVRALPLGGQAADDHRYLIGLAAVLTESAEVAHKTRGPRSEAAWWFGTDTVRHLAEDGRPPASAAFPDGGAYVMRGHQEHVFIDAGPVGMRGRGGHGHNDCLGFEATLDGVPLITDCGSFVYGADPAERDRFRATAQHNTPEVDGREINRFVDSQQLFRLMDDARPRVLRWQTGNRDILVARHDGYHRLLPRVTPVRTIVLDHRHVGLVVHDRLLGRGDHRVRVPFHLAPGVHAGVPHAGRVELETEKWRFIAVWREADDWIAAIEDGWTSPAYGIKQPIKVLSFRRRGPLSPLTVGFFPADRVPAAAEAWMAQVVADAAVPGGRA